MSLEDGASGLNSLILWRWECVRKRMLNVTLKHVGALIVLMGEWWLGSPDRPLTSALWL